MSKKQTNEKLVNNSNHSQTNEEQLVNNPLNEFGTDDFVNVPIECGFNNEEVEVCEIRSFCLEDIIDEPSVEEIRIWKEMSNRSWDGELCSDEIRELWISELKSQIENWF